MRERLSDRWLLEQLKGSELKVWIKNLEFFYFFRAWGGHASDGDRFEAHIKFKDKEDLLNKMDQLGVGIKTIPKEYSSESDKPKSKIVDFPELEQPGHATINDVSVFIWVFSNNIVFSISGCADGNRYAVSDKDYKACLEIEKVFKRLDWEKFKNTEVESDICCITEERYGDVLK